MNRKQILYLSVFALLLLVVILLFRKGEDTSCQLYATVQRGTFESQVYSSGQLESEKSENIYIPEKLKDRNLQIWQLNITDLVEEGTIVDSGDYVASLDHKVVEEKMSETRDEMEKILSEYEDSKIDSNLNLSNQRDAIVNAELDLQEKKLIVEESAYESPSVQKKAEMDLDKATRKLEQEQKAYVLKKQQEENKVNRKFISYRQIKDRLTELGKLYDALDITSPKPGIITYYKSTWGEVTKVGSMVGSWNPIIATIPDMTSLISRTYINEIDISKIKVGQEATIRIDAFPEKELEGEVTNVANIGQLMPNSDAKVFEVKIKIFGDDPDLKPAMTTSNIIQSKISQDTLFIPTESVFENDSIKFVYVNTGNNIRKQVVWLGDENENFVIVREGLEAGDRLCMVQPDDANGIELEGLAIYDKILQEKAEQDSIKGKQEPVPPQVLPDRPKMNH